MKNLLLIIVLIAFSLSGIAQNSDPDYKTFLKQTQLTNTENGAIDVVWWIPLEFWEIALKRNEDISEAQLTDFLEVLKPYVMFAVVKGESGEFGDFTFSPFETFEGKVTAISTFGKTEDPIAFEDLSVSVQTLITMVKPILKSAMGQMGENMHFFVFEDQPKKKRNFDPLAEGEISLQVIDTKYSWPTPVEALLPLKLCPIDAAEWNGAWNYCPIHGNELVDAEE